MYDIETYPNVFLLCAERTSDGAKWTFEMSDRRNDGLALCGWLAQLNRLADIRMVGFNNLAFDYPVVHGIYTSNGTQTAYASYVLGQQIIHSQDVAKWKYIIPPRQWIVPQLDLFKIHHFDNRARSASLKHVQFCMRCETIDDMPFDVGSMLHPSEIDRLIQYCHHDVMRTNQFLDKTMPQIEFRGSLSKKYGRDYTNYNDTKIGKDYLISEIESRSPGRCYVIGTNTPNQTVRNEIRLNDAVSPTVQFECREFRSIVDEIRSTTIYSTKSAFKLTTVVGGFAFHFGTGGVHGSVSPQSVVTDDNYQLVDLDVASYYPSLAIAQEFYPEHLGRTFVDVYREVRDERKKYPKGSPENAMLKLAGNGVYGDSGNEYSPFYDPLFTMKVTINGQLFLCMLAEKLFHIDGLRLIQINTDGVTVLCPKTRLLEFRAVCKQWENLTSLVLEDKNYKAMHIRDVNNYIAESTDGKRKRKGAYQYDEWLGYHQDQSSLVVAKAAEAELCDGVKASDYILRHQDFYDFLIRAKAPSGGKLVIADDFNRDVPLPRTTRFYVSKVGHTLTKILPPLARKVDDRRIRIAAGWLVTPCNDILTATQEIDYQYYIDEAEKLIKPLRP